MHHEPLIIGHRGAAAVAPENTLLSFRRALADGADGIEFDVQLASDGVPVVIHDRDLRRTARRDGLVSSLSSAELGRIDVGTWFNLRRPSLAVEAYARATIPTLAQVFEMFGTGPALLYVELKCDALTDIPRLAREVARLIREYSFVERVVIESFALEAIVEIKRLDAELRTAALFEPRVLRPLPLYRKLIKRALECRAEEIALHRALATRRAIEEAARRGLKAVVWTVDSPAWVRRAARYGLHAVITNHPALMRELKPTPAG